MAVDQKMERIESFTRRIAQYSISINAGSDHGEAWYGAREHVIGTPHAHRIATSIVPRAGRAEGKAAFRSSAPFVEGKSRQTEAIAHCRPPAEFLALFSVFVVLGDLPHPLWVIQTRTQTVPATPRTAGMRMVSPRE
jgi:hypothetical protein